MSLDFDWLLAAGGTAATGTPQPDPNASLSGRVSSTKAYALESALTGVGANARSVVIDTSQIAAQDWTGAWMVFESGTNDGVARKVAAFNDSTGTFTFERTLDVDAVALDDYRLWIPNGILDPMTNAQCSARAAKHRLLFFRNESGVSLQDVRAWVQPLEMGQTRMDVALGNAATVVQPVVGVAVETDAPAISAASDFVQSGWSNGAERWASPVNEATALYFTPLSLDQTDNWPNNQYLSVFLRVGFLPGDPIPIPGQSIWQLNISSATGPRLASAVFELDILGADEDLILGPDRAARLAAGARIQAVVRDASSGEPIPNHTVSLSQLSGPGTLGPQSAEVTDESGNPIRAVYLSPTDPGDVGSTATFRVEVN